MKIYKYFSVVATCVIDQTAAVTFDNMTYPLQLHHNHWTVLLVFVPEYARITSKPTKENLPHDDLQLEEYVVLVRSSGNDHKHKEVKAIVRSPRHGGKLYTIEMKPGNPNPIVIVNQVVQATSPDKIIYIEDDLIQIYTLLNDELKVEISDDLYIIYDGHRVKVSTTSDQLKGSIRGLCGTYSGDDQVDFTVPQNCVVGDPQEFVSSYTLDSSLHSKPQSHCYKKRIAYANVISEHDSGSSASHKEKLNTRNGCTKYQTRYVEKNGKVCFTVRALPTCKAHCKHGKMIKKKVDVHCVNNSNMTKHWQKQIDKGASPDFSHKPVHDEVLITMPQTCSQ